MHLNRVGDGGGGDDDVGAGIRVMWVMVMSVMVLG